MRVRCILEGVEEESEGVWLEDSITQAGTGAGATVVGPSKPAEAPSPHGWAQRKTGDTQAEEETEGIRGEATVINSKVRTATAQAIIPPAVALEPEEEMAEVSSSEATGAAKEDTPGENAKRKLEGVSTSPGVESKKRATSIQSSLRK